MTYLLDAGVFVQARNLHYGFDFCPAFWDWIDAEHSAGRVFSTEKAGAELRAGADDLAAWAVARADLFARPDAAVIDGLRAVSEWATSSGYPASAAGAFLGSGEFYLIAQAQAHKDVVVTHEAPGRGSERIAIPDACAGVGVKCVTPFRMLRQERARFVLG